MDGQCGEAKADNSHHYMVGVYVTVDGSEAHLLLIPPNAYYAWNEEAKLELEF